MDEKIKQTIEEMELVMHNSFGCRYFSTKEMILNNDRFFNREATAIYNAGYRKESDTAREILECLRFLIEERNCVGGYDLEDETIDGTIFVEILNELKERYGVEVE